MKTNEIPWIEAAALRFGVDARFIATVRKIENGGPGREFGVLDGHATTYELQVEECCRTVAHRIYLFDEDEAPFEYTTRGLVLSQIFIAYFAAIWAPFGVSNDPTNLNAHWLPNARLWYATACIKGLEALVEG